MIRSILMKMVVYAKNIQNFEPQYNRSTIPLLVLYFLSQKEIYAYEIIQNTLSMSNGAVGK